MKTISLTQGQFALVSDCDYEELSKHKWTAQRQPRKNAVYWTATRRVQKDKIQQSILMHRAIMNPPKGMVVDHIDNNPLNNQRENLRICTQAQNNINRGKTVRNKSGYKGVTWYIPTKKWVAMINANGKQRTIGYYPTAELAFEAYSKEAIKHHGEFVNLK